MGKERIKSGETMIVGDGPEEIRIGREMGLKSVSITDGFCSLKRLKAKRPDHLVKRLDEIIGLIDSF